MQQKEFADLLYTTCESDVVECFSRVFGLMRNEKDENGITAFDELAHVWLALITAEVCSVNGISAFKDNEMAHPIPIKAMIPVRIDVEGQVANTEKRKPEFNLQGKELCSPFDLTPKQDTGLDKYESLAAVDAVVHHRLKTAPGIDAFFVGDVKKEVENFAIRKGSGISSSELPDNDEDRREFFMGQLKMAQRMRQGSHYVRLSCEDHAQDHSALCELHRWCPGLLLFDVSREYKSERVMNLTTLNLIIFEAKTFLAEKNTTQS